MPKPSGRPRPWYGVWGAVGGRPVANHEPEEVSVVLSIQRRDGSVRTVGLGAALGLMAAIAAVGGFAGNALAWVGYRGASPNARFAALAQTDTAQMRRQDALEVKIDAMNRLQLQMAAMRCLSPEDARQVRDVLLPCGRIFRDLEITP